MKNVIIVGGSGMIGKLVLEGCLQRNDVNKITSIVRRPLGIINAKLIEVIHNDFLDYSPIEKYFNDQDICFYCIGVYTGQVSIAEFKKITVDFTRVFSETLRRYNDTITFCFLSGQGADSSEKSRILFAREKGIAENNLLKLRFERTHIFRPGYIYPDIQRKEPNLLYKAMRIVYKPLRMIYPNIGLTSTKLATKMIDVGFGIGDKVIYENEYIRKG